MFHDVGKFIPFLKLSPNIIRATNFVEESVTRYHIKGFLIRIKLRNCLHDIELSISNPEILKSSEPGVPTDIRRLIRAYDYLKWGKK